MKMEKGQKLDVMLKIHRELSRDFKPYINKYGLAKATKCNYKLVCDSLKSLDVRIE